MEKKYSRIYRHGQWFIIYPVSNEDYRLLDEDERKRCTYIRLGQMPVRVMLIPGDKEEAIRTLRELEAEVKRQQRQDKCRVERGSRCTRKCEECEYYLLGGVPQGNVIYYDNEDAGIEPESSTDVEGIVCDAELLEELAEALDELDPDSRKICEFIGVGLSERAIAKEMGVKRQSTLNYRKKKVLAQLRERLEKK